MSRAQDARERGRSGFVAHRRAPHRRQTLEETAARPSERNHPALERQPGVHGFHQWKHSAKLKFRGRREQRLEI